MYYTYIYTKNDYLNITKTIISGIPPITNLEEIEKVDNAERIVIIIYLSQIYHLFRGEIPFIRHSKTVTYYCFLFVSV